MSFKLSDLQDIAESNGPSYFIGDRRMVCLHATLYAINDALTGVDDIDYVPLEVVKASSGLVAGLWSAQGTCGILLAGGIAVSLKHGVSDPYDLPSRHATGIKAREFYNWFKKEYGSCTCCDISLVNDWSDEEAGEWYNENRRSFCSDILGKTARKLVDILTVNNSNVMRDE